MAVIHVKNKKNGTVYVYESKDYWDKEKKQSRSTRVCIGKVDQDTGEIITSKRLKTSTTSNSLRPGPVLVTEAKHYYYGATYLLDEIGKKLGIIDDMKKCFPDNYQKILSIAYFLILEDNNPLYRFSKWAAIHRHPYGKDISSQRSSEFFSSISDDARFRFFNLQGKRRIEREYWAYDITSLSTYSECLNQVRYGVSKEDPAIEQINLAILFGQQSGLPFYYKKLAGNISDVKTIHNLLNDLNFLHFNKIKLLLDRGFYSEENINGMFQNHLKFLIGAKTSLKYVKSAIENARCTISNWQNYNPNNNLYVSTSTIDWHYTQKRAYKGDVITDIRRAYLHIYFDKERETAETHKFNVRLLKLKSDLESGKINPEVDNQHRKYFDIQNTPKQGVKVIPRDNIINEHSKNAGYFALLTNDVKDPIEAIELYRGKDMVEKAFGDLKERLNFRRIEVSSELSLNGKLFVEFVALIFLSYLKKMMQDKDLFRTYTMQSLLDEFDIIDCYELPGHKLRFGEMTKRQIELYQMLGINPPTSL